MRKLIIALITVALFVFLISFWISNKVPFLMFAKIEPSEIVTLRPMYIEKFSPDLLPMSEFVCMKSNVYVTNMFGVKERVFSDEPLKGDELNQIFLSPDKKSVIAQIGNQTCGGADTQYTYYKYIELFTGKQTTIAGKNHSFNGYNGNISYSPDSKHIAYFNENSIYVFDTQTGQPKLMAPDLTTEPLESYTTNEAYQKSSIQNSTFVTSSLANNIYTYFPTRNLAWKDSKTLYYFYDLFHDETEFYALDITTGKSTRLRDLSYDDFQMLKKHNTKHQISHREYPLESAKIEENYRKSNCMINGYYSLCLL